MAIRTPIGEFQDPGSPVRRIPGEPPNEQPTEAIGLCLSGGGYRAMLFHLGAVWRLNELGMLRDLDRVSSVSGGSITAAVLGMNWSHLDFDAAGVGQGLRAAVVDPIRRLAGRTIDLPAVLLGLLRLGLAGGQTTPLYRQIFGAATLQDLPARPRFVINATSLQSGVLWRFTKAYMADYRVGRIPTPRTPLAVAVAASAAFPPFLSPIYLHLSPKDFLAGSGGDLTIPPYTSRAVLTDGGVYDNLGLETAWKRCRTILISDGGGSAGPQPNPSAFWPLQAYRVLITIDNQVGALRKRQAIDGFIAGARRGTYWGIASHIDDYHLPDAMRAPAAATEKLAAVGTRLKALDGSVQERLINWGYAICDAAIRKHVDPGRPVPAGFPYPAAGVGEG
jgi:NTE family protein